MRSCISRPPPPPAAKICEYLIVIPQLSNPACCFKYLKDNKHRGSYLTLKNLSFFQKGSPVHGSIQRGDTVLSLYGCQVYDKQDWNSCIGKTLQSPQHGYCTDMLTITRKNSSKGELKGIKYSHSWS